MKVLGAFAAFAAAQDTEWPAASMEQVCGAVRELPMAANQTCEVTIAGDLQALWVNAGGSFVTQPSITRNKWFIHTYEGHGEEDGVRFVSWFKIPFAWPYQLRNPKLTPQEVKDACGSSEDIDIECTDIGEGKQGLFMAPFNFAPGNNDGTYAIPVINTAGHKKDNLYTFELKNQKYDPVPITDIELMANGTVMATALLNETTNEDTGIKYADDGKFGIMLDEDYQGELLYITFKNKDPENMEFFDGPQAFYSFIN